MKHSEYCIDHAFRRDDGEWYCLDRGCDFHYQRLILSEEEKRILAALADRDATIAEMREALEVLNDASKRVHNTHNGHVACTAKNCAAKDALIKAEAILAKYPQKGK